MENQQNDNNNSNNINNTTRSKEEELLRRPLVIGGLGGGGGGGSSSSDRLRRDEWSEGAVSSLLDAYEAKWMLRNRTKLKGQDWEDVAGQVSSRSNGTRSPKTMTQCKNKIESMKKRYRSESASSDPSSWPLFNRLHLLLRCRAPPAAPPLPPSSPPSQPQPLMLLDHHPPPPSALAPPPPPPPPPHPQPVDDGNRKESPGINGVLAVAEENGVEAQLFNERPNNIALETDSSTPTCSGDKETPKKKKKKKKKRKMDEERDDWDLADSVRWLAEVVVRSEQARIDTMRELERIRAEAEAKKGEMDLKRTQIIANTQLEIARLLVGKSEDVDSSLKIGRN